MSSIGETEPATRTNRVSLRLPTSCTEEDLRKLFLAQSEPFSELNASGVKLSATCFQMVCEYCLQNRSIDTLNVAGNRLGDDAVAFICRLIEGSNVRTLRLGDNAFSDAGAAKIAETLRRAPGHALQTLHFGGNPIKERGMQELCAAIAESSSIKSVGAQNLILSEGVTRSLSQMLATSQVLRELHLRSNTLTDSLCSILSTGLARAVQIESLIISNTRLTITGLSALLTSLNALKTLHVSENALQVEGARLVAAFVKRCSTLQNLCACGCDFGSVGMSELAPAFASHPSLSNIELASNNISDDGAVLIATVLRENEHCASVSISSNNVTTRGVTAVCDAAENHRSLHSLNVSSNRLGPEGGAVISGFIKRDRSLRRLIVSNCNFDDATCRSIADALQDNPSLCQLIIASSSSHPCVNSMREETYARLLELVKRNEADGRNFRGDEQQEVWFDGTRATGLGPLGQEGSRVAKKVRPRETAPAGANGAPILVPAPAAMQNQPAQGFENRGNPPHDSALMSNQQLHSMTMGARTTDSVGVNAQPPLMMLHDHANIAPGPFFQSMFGHTLPGYPYAQQFPPPQLPVTYQQPMQQYVFMPAPGFPGGVPQMTPAQPFYAVPGQLPPTAVYPVQQHAPPFQLQQHPQPVQQHMAPFQLLQQPQPMQHHAAPFPFLQHPQPGQQHMTPFPLAQQTQPQQQQPATFQQQPPGDPQFTMQQFYMPG